MGDARPCSTLAHQKQEDIRRHASLFTGLVSGAEGVGSESARKILKEGGTEKMRRYSAFKRFAGNGLFMVGRLPSEEQCSEELHMLQVLKAFAVFGVGS